MAASSTRQPKLSSYWVKDVLGFSSQYMDSSWSARNVIGPSRVYPRYGDNPGTWTHMNPGSATEFLELSFEEKIFIKEIDIYEVYNCGAVVKIEVKGPGGDWVEVYSVTQPSHVQTSTIFSPSIQETSFKTNEMKLTINASASGDWYELDAVQIKGRAFKEAPAPRLEDLAHDLGCMVNKQDFSDVTFLVEGQRVYGHRVILAARCPYFTKKFTSAQTEEIAITDLSHNALLALLEFLYTNDVSDSVPLDVVTQLLRFAKQQSFEGLANFCDKKIFQAVSSENVVKVYRDACDKSPVLESVKTVCLEYMSSNMDTVCRAADFTELPREVMVDIIQQTVGQSK